MTIEEEAPRAIIRTGLVSGRIIAAAVALAIGVAAITAVGFARNDFLHAAAHDARHAAGFPCH